MDFGEQQLLKCGILRSHLYRRTITPDSQPIRKGSYTRIVVVDLHAAIILNLTDSEDQQLVAIDHFCPEIKMAEWCASVIVQNTLWHISFNDLAEYEGKATNNQLFACVCVGSLFARPAFHCGNYCTVLRH